MRFFAILRTFAVTTNGSGSGSGKLRACRFIPLIKSRTSMKIRLAVQVDEVNPVIEGIAIEPSNRAGFAQAREFIT